MLHFDGDKDFSQATAEVWSKLSDARFLVQCIPGLETVIEATPTRAQCILRPGFSFVRGTLEVTLTVIEAVANTLTRVLVHGKGIGSTSVVQVTLELAPRDQGTHAHWTADITELGGLLKAVPQGLIKASAQKVLADLLTIVEAKLPDPRPPTPH
jgi:carbon monoxide dehydrogenase subunit G